MKVAICIRQLKKSTGAARIALAQARAHLEKGDSVDLIVESFKADKIMSPNLTLRKIFTWPSKGLKARRKFQAKAQKVIDQQKYDLVIGHGDTLGQNILYMHNCVHGAHEAKFGQALDEQNEMAIIHGDLLRAQRFDQLVANSQLMANDFVRRFNIPEKKIKVSYPTIDMAQFTAFEGLTEPGKKIRSSLGIKDTDLLIGLVTSGDFEKRNVAWFIKALNSFDSSAADVHVLIVGKEKHKAKFAELLKSSSKIKLHFLDPIDRVEHIYAALDIFVLPAVWEEFGLVVLEAMAAGKPVVVSDKVGANEILEGEARSFIFSPTDAKAMLGQLKLLCESTDLRTSQGKLNQQTAKKYIRLHA